MAFPAGNRTFNPGRVNVLLLHLSFSFFFRSDLAYFRQVVSNSKWISHFCYSGLFVLSTFILFGGATLAVTLDDSSAMEVLRSNITRASICCFGLSNVNCISSEYGGLWPRGLWSQTDKGLHSWARSWRITPCMRMSEAQHLCNHTGTRYRAEDDWNHTAPKSSFCFMRCSTASACSIGLWVL